MSSLHAPVVVSLVNRQPRIERGEKGQLSLQLFMKVLRRVLMLVVARLVPEIVAVVHRKIIDAV